MGLTAVILTFHSNALYGALLLALGVLSIGVVFLRRRRHGLAIAGGVAVAWFVLALFSVQVYLGISVASVEVVQYQTAPPDGD
ncbi:MAG: hypothetical protein ABIJ09_07170 [Pseudomonadota bacterium]